MLGWVCVDATIGNFSEMLEDFCGRAEIPSDDRDEAEWLSMPLADLKILVNEIISIRAKKLLNLVPVDILVRLLRVLDHQIHRAEGLSVDECEHVSLISLSSYQKKKKKISLSFCFALFYCLQYSISVGKVFLHPLLLQILYRPLMFVIQLNCYSKFSHCGSSLSLFYSPAYSLMT